MISLPGYYNDPYVAKTQDDLYGYGSNLLAGNPNSYYKPIGEIGGSEFEDVLKMSSRDITQAAAEDAARRGVRGGGSTVARAVADMSKTMRFADFNRALEGRKFFLNTGNEMVGGVRSAAITEENNKNDFNLNSTRLQMQQDQFQQQQDAAKKAAKAAMYAKILSTAVGVGLAPFTGGASLGLMGFGGAQTGTTGAKDFSAASSLPSGSDIFGSGGDFNLSGVGQKNYYNF